MTETTEMGIERAADAIWEAAQGLPVEMSFADAQEFARAALSTRTPEAAQVDILREALIEARGELVRLRERYGTAHSEVVVSRIDTALAQVGHPLESAGR